MLFGEQPVGGADLRRRAVAVQAERGVMIFSGVLQFPSLLRGSGGGSFLATARSFFIGQEQVCPLEQPAEIFFAGDLRGALLRREADHGFVFHFQPFEPDDAEILSILFPDLALAKFHAWRGW